jgi:pilus assembly protein CpaE
LLIDLDMPLGDVALQLGMNPQYSVMDALGNYARLDGNFLSRTVMKHSSGLSVLASPGKVIPYSYSVEPINKLLQVARQQFDSVVVDTGSRMELMATSLFEGDVTPYLVTPVGISELRNANRLITECFNSNASRLQVVLNRFSNSVLGVDEEHITKALTLRAQWRVADDIAAARKMHDTGTPLVLHDALIARSVRQMARTGAGMPDEEVQKKKKKSFGLF